MVQKSITLPLQFAMVDGRPSVGTRVEVVVQAPCQWCLQQRPITLVIETRTLLAKDDVQAEAWTLEQQQQHRPAETETSFAALPVVVANELDFDPIIWLEDELLLAWPAPVCRDTACEWRPAASYGDNDMTEAQLQEEATARNPFSELAQLKAEMGTTGTETGTRKGKEKPD